VRLGSTAYLDLGGMIMGDGVVGSRVGVGGRGINACLFRWED